jgi:hypothetical protein
MRADTVDRRHFLRLTGPAVAALVAGKAPAQAQGTPPHLLQWSHFIPAADTLFEAQAREFAK